MIESLTEEQESQIEVYKNKWLKIGLSTEKCDRAEAEKWAAEAYKKGGYAFPKKVVWCDSPYDCCIEQLMEKESISKKEASKRLKGTSKDSKTLLSSLADDQAYGSHDSFWLGFYNYFLEVVNLECCEDLVPLMNLAENCGWWAPYDTVCFLQEKADKILFNDNEDLHCDGGAAIEYKDGFSVHALNGTVVPEWVAVTNPEKLDLKKIMKIKNVDVRAQALKRYTPERLITDGKGTVIEDKWDDEGYKLIDLSDLFETYDYAPHLLMKNASVPGLIHCEGVPAHCKTIEDALTYRSSKISNPERAPDVLT